MRSDVLTFRSVNVVENGVGLAGIGTICGGCSTGVNDDLKTTSGMALTMSHELGHNLGKYLRHYD